MTGSKLIATPQDALTYKITGCAMAVHRQLGPSHRENAYQRDLGMHFTQAGLSFEAQKLYEVHDNGRLVGYGERGDASDVGSAGRAVPASGKGHAAPVR